jgi:hypothetical protein
MDSKGVRFNVREQGIIAVERGPQLNSGMMRM